MARRQPLVCQHLENVSRSMLVKYQDSIGAYMRGRRGVYALYRREQLYYVGLARNLRVRLRHHLRDRHGTSWDRFSVYLTIGGSHLRELESLVLRVARPKGNRQKGRLAKSENLLVRLRRTVRDQNRQEDADLFGTKRGTRSRGQPGRVPPGGAELLRYIHGPMPLRARYKGELLRARVRRDGTIRYAGKVFRSPSAAARAVVKRQESGWEFWECERAPGDWVKLKELRKR